LIVLDLDRLLSSKADLGEKVAILLPDKRIERQAHRQQAEP